MAAVALVALVGPHFSRNALAATQITVDSELDSFAPGNQTLYLREAMMLATGDLELDVLSMQECDNVSTAFWGFTGECTAVQFQEPGPNSADTIVFDPSVFPPGSPETIQTFTSLPELDTGGDSIHGIGAGVIIEAFDDDFTCFPITSSNNGIRGLQITNCQTGVSIVGGESNTIGGEAADDGNTFSGNVFGVSVAISTQNTIEGNLIQDNTTGINLTGNLATENLITGNLIGTDASGLAAVGNFNGIVLDEAPGNFIGSSGPAGVGSAANLISGNTTGIYITAETADGNVVSGNYIGTDVTGTQAVPNSTGVRIAFGPDNNIVDSNLISGNTFGVHIETEDTTGNVVSGNIMGTDVTGAEDLGNLFNVTISDSPNNHIGPSSAASSTVSSGGGNLISGSGIGVTIGGATAQSNTVSGNLIGTDITGTAAIDSSFGVRILEGANNNTIGGDTPAERNVISSFSTGVRIDDQGSSDNQIVGNYIGTDVTGEQVLGTGAYGVQLTNFSSGNVVRGNLVAGSSGASAVAGVGVTISFDNEIHENRIGVSPTGAPLGNDLYGIFLRNASNNLIGSVGGDGNTIANNGADGIRVSTDGGDSFANTIRGNSIYSNDGAGIETINNGNLELAPPVITGFGSISGIACANCTLDVYSDDEDEGRVYEGTTTADGVGDWTLEGQFVGPNATATATDIEGNTSEFSQPATVPNPATPTPSATPSGTPEPTPSPTPEPSDFTQGDNDCDGDSDAVDALVSLQSNAGFPYNQEEGCIDIGAAVPAGGDQQLFGDIDCDGDVDAVDALQILRNVAGLPVNQEQGCVEIGHPL